MIHTPVDNWKKISEAAAALEKEWVKLEKMPAWDPKQAKERKKKYRQKKSVQHNTTTN